MLKNWIGSPVTTDEDIAAFIGWDVAKVRRYRAQAN
jgi:hypothetical protein